MRDPATPSALPTSAYLSLPAGADPAPAFISTALTTGPWDPGHQHGGPPVALLCRAIEDAARPHGLTHVARLTANLLRPIPVDRLRVRVSADYVGRSAGHFSASLYAQDKEIIRLTGLVQREDAVSLPRRPPAPTIAPPEQAPPGRMPFAGRWTGYADLVDLRVAAGRVFDGPCTAWFRLAYPLVDGEPPSPYQRVAVAADSGNGISAELDFERYLFVNPDLTINLYRRPVGEWICLQARTQLSEMGTGLAESALFDAEGLIGHATQTLTVRAR